MPSRYLRATPAFVAVVALVSTTLLGAPSPNVAASGLPPAADAGVGYAITEGQDLTLDASGTFDAEGDPLTFGWDIDGDGSFADAVGLSPTVSWAELQALGVDDDGGYSVSVRASDGTSTADASAPLTVANQAPDLIVERDAAAAASVNTTLSLSAIDPGDDTIVQWRVLWGDGAVDAFLGAEVHATHTYAPGFSGRTANILVSAIDEDGLHNPADALVPNFDGLTVGRYDASSGVLEASLGDPSLSQPYAATVGPDGLLYVSSYGTDRIDRFDLDTNTFVDTFVATGAGGLTFPKLLTFGPDGNLYVASAGTGDIKRFDAITGLFVDNFIIAGSGGLADPGGLLFTPTGELLVTDQFSDTTLRFDAITGAYIDTFVTYPFGAFPSALAIGPDGQLYTTLNGLAAVSRHDSATGAYLSDMVPSGSGGLDSPNGLAFATDGELWVSSYVTNSVKRYDGTTGAYLDDRLSATGPFPLTFVPSFQLPVRAAITVNSTGDAGDAAPSDGTCSTGGLNAQGAVECTLRAAIETANRQAGADAITFNIPTVDPGYSVGANAWTITPGSDFEAVSEATVIDGSSQSGYTAAGRPVIELDGSASSGSGFHVTGANTTIRGLAINRFGGSGILVNGAGSTRIVANRIGTTPDGLSAAGNAQGLLLNAQGVTVGGSVPADGNIVSGNTSDGVLFGSSLAANGRVEGNLIGVDGTGLNPLGNGEEGVQITGADDVVVTDNTIGANAYGGVRVFGAARSTITANGIGVGIDGSTALGNGFSGIQIATTSTDARIGGANPADGNIVANSQMAGILTSDSATAQISGNAIYANGELGIDVSSTNGTDGVTPNSLSDSWVDFPTLLAAVESGGQITVSYTLAATAGTYRVEFFANPSSADGTGYGEGEVLVSTAVIDHPGGDVGFTHTFAGSVGDEIAATTTALDGSGTSEFSNIANASTPAALTVNSSGDSDDVTPGDGVCTTGGVNALGAAECTLRAALTESIATSTITDVLFDLPVGDSGYTGSFWRIEPAVPFADVTASVTIDGSSQAGFATAPLIQLDGATAGSGDGLRLAADGIEIIGLSFTSWADNGIIVNANNAVLDTNYLGITPDSSAAGNGTEGIVINGDGTQITGNIFGNNSAAAVSINNPSTATLIAGNTMGTDQTGLVDFGNGSGVWTNTTGTITLGGLASADENIITNSGRAGVVTTSASGLSVLRNRIFSNVDLGIDLLDDGQSPNTTLDALTDHPTITAAVRGSSSSTVSFETDLPAGDYRIDVYSSPSADGTGFGEGTTYRGTVVISHGGAGVEVFNVATSAPLGEWVSAIATPQTGPIYGASSEFSNAIQVTAGSIAVNSTLDRSDIAPGDGACYTGFDNAAADPECTLRAAIEEANADPSPSPIAFALATSDPGYLAGIWTISPTTDLPYITAPVDVDGTTQAGYSSTPLIQLDGLSSGGALVGLYLTAAADDSAIAGLAITSWSDDGIWISADRVRIVDNHIGVAADGVTLAPNAAEGIAVLGDADTVNIEDNVIGGHVNAAIGLTGNATNVVITGNTLGTDRTGTLNLGNGQGVWSDAAGTARIGGTTAAERNTIANNLWGGIDVAGPSSVVAILGNSFRDNGDLAIDLGADGPTPNDPLDGDIGANGLLNAPQDVGAVATGTITWVNFTLDVPAGDYRVEIFLDESGGHPLDYGQGRLESAIGVVHPGGGPASWRVGFGGLAGEIYSASATENPGFGSTFGATSELSTPVISTIDRTVDASPTGNNAALDGGIRELTSRTSGMVGDAININGGTQRLEAGPTNIETNAFSISAWVDTAAMAGQPRILAKSDSSATTTYELWVDASGPTPRLTASIDTFPTTGSVDAIMPTAGWHHVAATWDGSVLALYLNGVEVAASAASPATLLPGAMTPLSIGNTAAGDAGWAGGVDEVRVAPVAFSAEQFRLDYLMVSAPSTVLAIGSQQSEASGPWTIDSSTTHNGTFAAAAPTSGTGWLTAIGLDEPGMELDTWWYVEDTGSAFTFGGRTQSSVITEYESTMTAAGFDAGIQTTSGRSTVSPSAGSPLPTGSWHRVVLRLDQNDNLTIIVDGIVEQGPVDMGSSLASGSFGFRSDLTGGDRWLLDDIVGRRLVENEPISSLSAVDRQ